MVFKSCGINCGLEKASCHFLNRAAAKHFVLLRTVFGTWDPRKQSHDGCKIRNSFLHVSGLDFACNLVLIPVHGLQDFAEFFLRGSLPSSGNCHCKKIRFLKASFMTLLRVFTSFRIYSVLWADESSVHLFLLHVYIFFSNQNRRLQNAKAHPWYPLHGCGNPFCFPRPRRRYRPVSIDSLGAEGEVISGNVDNRIRTSM